MFNRRRDEEGEVKTEELELDRVGMDDNDISQYYETISIHTESSQPGNTKTKTSDSITRIYACATMWHETKSEMMEMLNHLIWGLNYIYRSIYLTTDAQVTGIII